MPRRPRTHAYLLTASLLAATLTGCGTAGVATISNAAPAPTVASIAALPTALPVTQLKPQAAIQSDRISGTGLVTAAHDAGLVFLVQGRIERVLIEEGQAVKQGQILATLDPRPFDNAIAQAEAGLAAAQAQLALLDEAPRAADYKAAEAQVQQAKIALAQAKVGQTQDVRSTEAALVAAQTNLQTTRDQLSTAKSIAEKQLSQASLTLTQAQARYAQAKYNWEYAKDDGRDPIQPQVLSNGKIVDNKLSDGAKEAYYAQYIQAEAAMHQAEQAVAQVQLGYEQARRAEANGVQATEQQVIQTQSALDKLKLPAGQDRVAAAQAALALAQANLQRLTIDPNQSQRAQAQAGVEAAKAVLANARLNREYAELRAPFDGVVTRVGIEAGEVATPAAKPAIDLTNTNNLRFDVPIAEVDIQHVRIGQPANLKLDALPDATISGNVSYIAPAAIRSGNVNTYLVRIELDRSEAIRIGMSGTISLVQP